MQYGVPDEITGQCGIAMTTALLVGGILAAGSTAATGVYGAHVQGKAAKEGAAAQRESNEAALAFERENENERQREWEETQAENRRNYDASWMEDQRRFTMDRARTFEQDTYDVDRYNAEQSRRQPYRDTSWAAVQSLAAQSGLNIQRTTAPSLAAPARPDLSLTPAPASLASTVNPPVSTKR